MAFRRSQARELCISKELFASRNPGIKGDASREEVVVLRLNQRSEQYEGDEAKASHGSAFHEYRMPGGPLEQFMIDGALQYKIIE
jgi:hypothetical protein